MGHHLKDGKFQSDKFPGLPPNHVVINIEKPRTIAAVNALIRSYASHDLEFAGDLQVALSNVITAEARLAARPTGQEDG